MTAPAPASEKIPYEIADPSRAREDECAGLRARIAALEAGLRPFAEEFQKRVQNPKHHIDRRNWNEKMPGEWPIELKVTMQNGRTARALLSPREDAHG